MAKQVYDYGDVQVEVKEKKGITLGRIFACVLGLGIIAVGVVCAGFASRNDEGKYFRNPNLSTWHWADKTPVGEDGGEQNGEDVTPGGNNASVVGGSDIGDITYNGVSVYKAVLPRAAFAAMGVSEQAEMAYTLTAEVSPDYTTDKSLDWSNLAFLDSESEWATGKVVTDYVTVTPSADGDSAVVACLQDFGEPIVLTVSSVSNPEVSATCSINYYQRIKSCEFAFFYDGAEITPTIENGVYKLDYTGAEKDYTVELRPVYSDYTLTDTYSTTINGALSSDFGYTATVQLNSLAILAGLMGGDPELTENALNWCNWVKTSFFEYSYGYNIENCVIEASLMLGNSLDVHGHYEKPKYILTEEEKQHPRCAYYISLLSSGQYETEVAFNQLKEEFYSYQPSVYNYYGAQIANYNDFVAAVNSCNNSGVGVIEYTITINGAHSSFTTVLSLGYNNEFKINVQDVTLSDTNVAF